MDGCEPIILREIIPRDYYWFSLLENDFADANPVVTNLQTLAILMNGDEDILYSVPKRHVTLLFWWLSKNLLDEKIMKLEQWFETSFHLCKQRFDVTMDWLESQPVSKILLMVNVLTKFNKEQEREMKKARRKK